MPITPEDLSELIYRLNFLESLVERLERRLDSLDPSNRRGIPVDPQTIRLPSPPKEPPHDRE